MTRWLRSSSAFLVLSSAVACGAPKSAAGPSDATAVTTSGSSTGAADTEPAPVATPEDLVFVARWRSPGATVDTLLGWTNLPLDWRSLSDRALPSQAKGAATTVFALDAPVDLVVTLGAQNMAEPEPQAVFAVGLQSVEAAVKFAETMGEEVEDLGRGIFAVGGGGDLECVIAPAAGSAAARLVCSEEATAVDELLPYVTQRLPTESLSDSDIHMEFRIEPIRNSYGPLLRQQAELGIPYLLKELSFDDPTFDRALANVVRGVTREVVALVDDFDKLTLDVQLTPDTEHLEMTLAAQFRGTQSWIAQGIADAQNRSSVAPKEFWGLPAAASAASFAGPANPDRARAIREATANLFDSALAHQKLPPRLREDVRYLVENWGTSRAVRIAVQGPVPSSPAPAGEGELAETLASLEQQWGWQAAGYLGEPADGFFRYFETLERVANDPAVAAAFRSQLPTVGAAGIPSLSSKRLYGKLAGAKQYDLTLPFKAWTGGATPDRKLVFVVMPDGKTTWLGSSLVENVLLEEMAKLKQPGKTLADQPGLEELRKRAHFSGGFFTSRHVLQPILTGSLEMKPADAERTFAAMPHRGETRMLTTIDQQAAGPRLQITISAPKAVVQDLAAGVPALLANSVLSGL